MAAIDLIEFPSVLASRINANGTLLMDAAAEKIAYLVQAPLTGTLNSIRFRTATVTTGDTLKVSFQGVDAATGDPDGVAAQYRTIVVASGDDNTILSVGLITTDGTDGGVKRSVTKGDLFFVVFEFDSFVAGSINLSSVTLLAASQVGYADHYTASWAKHATTGGGIGLVYNDGVIYYTPSCGLGTNVANGAFSSSSTPDEVALKFKFPVAQTISGAWYYVDGDGDYDIVLYDSDGTTSLASKSFDKDVRQSTLVGLTYFLFASEITISAETYYYLSLKPTTTTGVDLRYSTFISADNMNSMQGGQSFHKASRTDAGAWTADTTIRPAAGLLLSTMFGASSGGGGYVIGS